MLTHSGFEHCFCYGDILLSFMWVGDDVSNIKRKLSTAVETPIRDESLKSQYSKHDFIRTQFHRTTHCDFCSKKVNKLKRKLNLALYFNFFLDMAKRCCAV